MDLVRSGKYTRINTLSNNKTYVLIPRGKKCFIYFTMENDEPCVILYDRDKKYIKKLYVCFDEELSSGTIMYGTLIQRTFIAEYLCLYKNIKLQHNLNNLNTLQAVLSSDIKNTANTTQIKLPFMCNTKSISYFTNISYPVYGVAEYGHRFNIFMIHDLLANFIIKKDEVVHYRYNLYVMRNNESVLHTNAFLNDIKTTFLIDTIFKKYKNYKTIEYSDTEDDDNDNDNDNDNHVNELLNTTKLVTCIYIPELKKWKPYLACKSKTADTFKTIRYIETNYN